MNMQILNLFIAIILSLKSLNGFGDDENLPKVPNGPISMSQAIDIREELEILRIDVSEKLEQLKIEQSNLENAKKDLDSKRTDLEEREKLLAESLQREKVIKEERLTSALNFFGKMDPKKAAPIFEQIDRDLGIGLMKGLKPSQVTKIIESMKPGISTKFLENYTRIRSGREYEILKDMGLCAQPLPTLDPKTASP